MDTTNTVRPEPVPTKQPIEKRPINKVPILKRPIEKQQPKNQGWRQSLNNYPWPTWVTGFRPHQLKAVEQILAAYDRGVKCVILDAPTGSGKTLIAEMVRVALGMRGIYVCSGIQLQEQFAKDFEYGKVLKGRSNYPTANFPFPQYTTADCNKRPRDNTSCVYCPKVSGCSYERAKSAALGANVACLNTTYYLYETNFIGRFSDRDFVVFDECDELESQLMGFVEFEITERMVGELGVNVPKKGAHRETIKSWFDGELLPTLEAKIKAYDNNYDPEVQKRVRQLEGLYGKALMVVDHIEDDNWIREYKKVKKNGSWVESDAFVMKPVKVGEFGKGYLWRHSKKQLLMSASVISSKQLTDDLGIGDYETVTVEMTFPVSNRPIVMAPMANMTSKTEKEERPKLLKGIERVISMHPGENVLVHTNSYRLTQWLMDETRGKTYGGKKTMGYLSSRDRDKMVEVFKRNGGILFAPSLERGVDLPGELCRVVIIAKVPYPNLGDKQTSTRLYLPGGQGWFNVKTVRSIVQMTGRGVRSKDDFAVSYILDKQFSKIWGQHKALLPEWWQEGVREGINSKWKRELRK